MGKSFFRSRDTRLFLIFALCFGGAHCEQECAYELVIVLVDGFWNICGTSILLSAQGSLSTLQIERSGPANAKPSVASLGMIDGCMTEPTSGTSNGWRVRLTALPDMANTSKVNFCFSDSNSCLQLGFSPPEQPSDPAQWHVVPLDRSLANRKFDSVAGFPAALRCWTVLSRNPEILASFLDIQDVTYHGPGADCPTSYGGCWQIRVFYSSGPDTMRTALFLPKAVTHPNSLPTMQQFPWVHEGFIDEATACTLDEFREEYVITADVSQWVEANTQHFTPRKTKTEEEEDFGVDFGCPGVQNFLVFPQTRNGPGGVFTDQSRDHTLKTFILSVDPDTQGSFGRTHAVIVIPEDDLQYIGYTHSDTDPGSTRNSLFIGLLEFFSTGTPYINGFANQVQIRLQKTGFVMFAVFTVEEVQSAQVELNSVELHKVAGSDGDSAYYASLSFDLGNQTGERRRSFPVEASTIVVSSGDEQILACAEVSVNPIFNRPCGPWSQAEQAPLCVPTLIAGFATILVPISAPPPGSTVGFALALRDGNEPVHLSVLVDSGHTLIEWCSEEIPVEEPEVSRGPPTVALGVGLAAGGLVMVLAAAAWLRRTRQSRASAPATGPAPSEPEEGKAPQPEERPPPTKKSSATGDSVKGGAQPQPQPTHGRPEEAVELGLGRVAAPRPNALPASPGPFPNDPDLLPPNDPDLLPNDPDLLPRRRGARGS